MRVIIKQKFQKKGEKRDISRNSAGEIETSQRKARGE